MTEPFTDAWPVQQTDARGSDDPGRTILGLLGESDPQWQIPDIAREIIPRELVRIVVARTSGEDDAYLYPAPVRIAAVRALIALDKQNTQPAPAGNARYDRPYSTSEIAIEVAQLAAEINAS